LDFEFAVSGENDSMGVNVVLVNIDLIIDHPNVGDLEISLISPSGIELELTNNIGGTGDNYGNPNNGLCDSATNFNRTGIDGPVTSGNPSFIGSFIPEGNFFDLNEASNPNGTWTLRICDDQIANTGILQYLALEFAPPPLCPTPINLSSNPGDEKVALSWENGSNGAFYEIQIGQTGFVPGTGNELVSLLGITVQNFTMDTATGLDLSMNYDWYVKETCNQ
jgi:hypothetical protein